MARARREHSGGAILFIDLDGFKTINDSLGHSAGDALLNKIGQRLLRQRRGEDTVARVGGDEFVVILSQLGGDRQSAAESAQAVAEKIQGDLSQPIYIADHELHMTPSIGVVLFPHDADNAVDLFTHADTAMYRAKAQGRDTIQFYLSTMKSTAMRRLALQNDLHRAVSGDQLLQHFQPQVDIQTGRIIGAEALLRWQHPERGLVSPAEFIPIAEETGLILSIGAWVLKTACSHAMEFACGQEDWSLSVNVSPRQFRQPDFVSQVNQIVSEAGINPALLTLELTEGMLIHDAADVSRKLGDLKELGFRLSIDDFGTGYSSLSYLKRFPLDTLKIDQSFIRDIVSDVNDAAIVRAIIAMAVSLNLHVTAEGVETENQLEFLRKEKCLSYQGYFFSHPLPAEEFSRLYVIKRPGTQRMS